METVTCDRCDAENSTDRVFCVRCRADLDLPMASSGSGPATAVDRTEKASPSTLSSLAAPPTCPECEAEVPDPNNTHCVECLLPFGPDEVPHRASPTPPPSSPTDTRREEARPSVVLAFAQGSVTVHAGETLLGRADGTPGAQILAAHDNVSRRHATVWLDELGTAWVRDEHSTNGTFVGDRPVPPGEGVRLQVGGSLRLGSDVTADVRRGGRR